MKKRTSLLQVINRKTLPLHLMLLPGVLLVFVYCYIPMAGIVIAFQDFRPLGGLFNARWVGLENFEFIFNYPGFRQALWNTVYISFMKIVLGLFVPIVISLLLNEVRLQFFKRGIQTLIYLPHFLSWIILSGILIDILSPKTGIVNQSLGVFGIEPIFFLGDNRWFPITLVISDVWKEFGFSTIIYLAALTSISPTLYEAAVMDGAGRWRQTWYITLPGMRPIIVLMVTLSLGNVLNAGFDQVFNLYNPIVYESGDIIDTMVYRFGIVDAQYSVATAMGLFKSVVSFVFISSAYWLAYRFANYRIF
ncbi:sugar ABC transporter permease [Paenibacillus sp. J2TS4]|uniref:ABC transporter permease n=1 Tax=Paenibacillus sp. J2TS4 TaxID=2807194 RepID=UPI001B05E68C|nr:ABC transporter permease subunit [Paenibacillus sp. J2TS4]GIP31646.1 sugar ABC transporter permease [Paenibacillus sp. J2TS4]